jgi:caffeoyl-CoA O-methyltransferase
MNKQFGNDDQRLAAYVAHTYAPEDDVLADIRTRSVAAGLPDIQVAALDARHLEVLARLGGARRAVEIGTLGGYSGVALLRGMGAAGTLDTIEIDPRHAELARETFRRAGFVRDRARIHVGRAADVLPRLAAPGAYDLVFIDADKESYPLYLEWATDNLRSGGMVLLDNAFLFGRLPDEIAGEHAAEIAAMKAVHEALASSGNWRATVLPTGEGLALGVKL